MSGPCVFSTLQTLFSSPDCPTGYVVIAVASCLFFVLWSCFSVRASAGAAADATRAGARALAVASGPITPAGLAVLSQHKYKSSEYTPVDLFMNGYWLWVSSLVPAWIAPNLVTLIGLGSMAAPALYGLSLSPVLAAPRPALFHALCVLGLFGYQTLDAVDGKHARATNSSSPLGQLFDHGCDAISVTFATLICAMTLQLSPEAFLAILAATHVPFFVAQWSERHTHVLRTSVGPIGLTETQLFAMALPLASAVSPAFWVSALPVAVAEKLAAVLVALPFPLYNWLGWASAGAMAQGLRFHHVVLALYATTAAVATVSVIIDTVLVLKKKNKLAEAEAEAETVDVSTANAVAAADAACAPCCPIVAALAKPCDLLSKFMCLSSSSSSSKCCFASKSKSCSALKELVPALSLCALTYLWTTAPLAATEGFFAFPLLAPLTLGTYFTKLSCEMIIAAMSRDAFPACSLSLLPLAAHIAAVTLFPGATVALGGTVSGAAAVRVTVSTVTLAVAVAGAAATLTVFVVGAALQIARYLGIYVLVQGRRPEVADKSE